MKKTLFISSIWLLFVFNLSAQEKKIITKAEDLPRHTYEVDVQSSIELIENDDKFKDLSTRVAEDIQNDLELYQIEDKTTLKNYYSTLLNLFILQNKNSEALELVEEIRALQEKPAAKLLTGISTVAMLEALDETENESDFKEVFSQKYREAIFALPWDVVEDEIKQAKGSIEIFSKNLVIGMLQSSVDPVIEKTGSLSGEIASAIINFQYMFEYGLPLKDERLLVLSDYIDQNNAVKPDIWAEREVNLTSKDKGNTVLLSIWDSGVDTEVFKDQLFINKGEKIDQKDNDGDGYVDNVYGIAYTLHSEKTPELLYPLTKEQQERLPNSIGLMKGLIDLQAAVESDEATNLKETLSQLKPEEVEPFLEELSLLGNYVHGTHVAGIALRGNPWARLMPARLSFDYRMIPDVPTIEKSKKEAQMYKETVQYFKKNNVRIVNMSWGGSQRDIERALEINGVEEDAEKRAELAAKIFKIARDGLYEAIASAPEILFITSGGNSDNDASFEESIPAAFQLPNILSVGAVDQAGEETDFTSFGESIVVYANGFEVESYIPGGDMMKLSGTSMSSPNVSNLAAKLLVLKPDLTPEQLIDLIIKGGDKSENGRVLLINPKNTMRLLKL